jgi:hypothetical protein
MRRNWLGLLFLIAVLGIAFYGYRQAVPPKSGQQPVLTLSEAAFDFGKVKYGQVLEHTFTVKNEGESILKIDRIATSCGCTTAKIDKEEIKPEEKAQLQVVFDTGVMGEAVVKGRQERFVYLKTNDPTKPQVTIKIVSEIE